MNVARLKKQRITNSMEILREIDFEKYHSFVLEYTKENEYYSKHNVRPCELSYEEIQDILIKKDCTRYITLDSVVVSFENNIPIPTILMECSVMGINIDYVDILAKVDKNDRWASSKCIQTIDMHKDDISKYIEGIESPRHYIARNKNNRSSLKYLVIDRFKQDQRIDFLKGDYDKKFVIAGFNEHSEARKYLKTLNEN